MHPVPCCGVEWLLLGLQINLVALCIVELEALRAVEKWCIGVPILLDVPILVGHGRLLMYSAACSYTSRKNLATASKRSEWAPNGFHAISCPYLFGSTPRDTSEPVQMLLLTRNVFLEVSKIRSRN